MSTAPLTNMVTSPLTVKIDGVEKSKFASKDEALSAARLRQGSEAIVKQTEPDGKEYYTLRDVTDIKKQLKNYITSDLDPSIVSFSIETSRQDESSGEYQETTVDYSQEIAVNKFVKDLSAATGKSQDEIAKMLSFKDYKQMISALQDVPEDIINNMLENIKTLPKTDLKTFSAKSQSIMVNDLQKAIKTIYPQSVPPTFVPPPQDPDTLPWEPQELGRMYSTVHNLKQTSSWDIYRQTSWFDQNITFKKTKDVEVDMAASLVKNFNDIMEVTSTDGKTLFIREGAITGDLTGKFKDLAKKKLAIVQRVNTEGFYNYTSEELKERWPKQNGAPKDRAALCQELLNKYPNTDALKYALKCELKALSKGNDPKTAEFAKDLLGKIEKMDDNALREFIEKKDGPLQKFQPGVIVQMHFLAERYTATVELQEFLNMRLPEGVLKLKVDGEYGTDTRKAVKQFQLDQVLRKFEDKIKWKINNLSEDKNYSAGKSVYEGILKLIQDQRTSLLSGETISFTSFEKELKKAQGMWMGAAATLALMGPGMVITNEITGVIQDLETKMKSIKNDFKSIAHDGNMDTNTINLLVDNWFNIMGGDGGETLLENLSVHEFGHFLENEMYKGSTLLEEIKKIDSKPGKMENIAARLTDTLSAGVAVENNGHFSIYETLVSEKMAEPYRGYILHTIELMKTSPIKFLALNAMSGACDEKQIMEFATKAFGSSAKDELKKAFAEIAGLEQGKFFKKEHFNSGFTAKVLGLHNRLAQNVGFNLENYKPQPVTDGGKALQSLMKGGSFPAGLNIKGAERFTDEEKKAILTVMGKFMENAPKIFVANAGDNIYDTTIILSPNDLLKQFGIDTATIAKLPLEFTYLLDSGSLKGGMGDTLRMFGLINQNQPLNLDMVCESVFKDVSKIRKEDTKSVINERFSWTVDCINKGDTQRAVKWLTELADRYNAKVPENKRIDIFSLEDKFSAILNMKDESLTEIENEIKKKFKELTGVEIIA